MRGQSEALTEHLGQTCKLLVVSLLKRRFEQLARDDPGQRTIADMFAQRPVVGRAVSSSQAHFACLRACEMRCRSARSSRAFCSASL